MNIILHECGQRQSIPQPIPFLDERGARLAAYVGSSRKNPCNKKKTCHTTYRMSITIGRSSGKRRVVPSPEQNDKRTKAIAKKTTAVVANLSYLTFNVGTMT